MTPEQRYLRLQERIYRCACTLARRARKKNYVRDELLSVAGLAFTRALADRHRARIPLDDWLMLCCQNAMQNALRGELRKERRFVPYPPLYGETFVAPEPQVEVLAQLSKDAHAVAEALVAAGMQSPRTAIDAAKRALYRTLGWRRYWLGIDEIREVLECY
jgi:DNA-directed RNA polymerase specialized sigma24 family protein